MKKLTIPLFFLITISFLNSCGKEEEKNIVKYYNTTVVQTGTLDLGENYVGYAEGIQQATLSTKSNGRITYLKANIGDNIISGELLASLDSSEAKVGYSTANSIIESMYSLKNHTSLSFDKQIKVLEKKIEEIKESEKGIINNTINLEKLKNVELESGLLAVKQAETVVETNKLELEESINIFEGRKQDIYKSGKNIITHSIILNTNIIYFTDELLGITKKNRDKNDLFDEYLGAKDKKILNETELSFIETNKLFLEYKSFYEERIENKSPSNEEIILGLEKGLEISEKMKEMLNLLYKTVDNSIDNVYLTLDTINNYKEKITLFGNQIEANILSVEGNFTFGLRGTVENLNSLEREYSKAKILLEKKIELAKDSLKTIEQNLNTIKANSTISTDNDISKKEILIKQIEGLKAQIESIKSEKNAKLKEVDSNITEIVGERDLAGTQIQNGNIYSPINGIILEKLTEVGEITSAGNPVYIVGDNSQIKLEIEIGNKKIEEIALGKEVNIEFEGIFEIMKGTITNIASSKSFETKKTTIEITVNNPNKKIKIGTIAKVSIPTIGKQSTNLIIPNSAILEQFSIPGVYILKNGKANFLKIRILKQNENFSEITGINPGEIIITDGKENIYDGEILN